MKPLLITLLLLIGCGKTNINNEGDTVENNFDSTKEEKVCLHGRLYIRPFGASGTAMRGFYVWVNQRDGSLVSRRRIVKKCKGHYWGY